MIEQVPGHRSYKWLEDKTTFTMVNFMYNPNFPLTSEVLVEEFNERVNSRGNNISCLYPNVLKTLPKPNCSMPALENSPHVWHFKETETEIEFLLFSDGLRKRYYKGTSVEVLYDENGYCKDDMNLSIAYGMFLEYVKHCWESNQLESLE